MSREPASTIRPAAARVAITMIFIAGHLSFVVRTDESYACWPAHPRPGTKVTRIQPVGPHDGAGGLDEHFLDRAPHADPGLASDAKPDDHLRVAAAGQVRADELPELRQL